MRTYSRNLACAAFCLMSLACGAFCFIKNLACGACFSYEIFLNHSGMHFIWSFWFCLPSTKTLVVKIIRTPILCDLNDTIGTKQYLQKYEITNPFSTQNRVSLTGMYVWGVNSMTKHSDYFVWKDTSERVARRYATPLTRSEWILVY